MLINDIEDKPTEMQNQKILLIYTQHGNKLNFSNEEVGNIFCHFCPV